MPKGFLLRPLPKGFLLSKSKTRITYPCGYVEEKATKLAVYGLRHNGAKPVLIEVFGKCSFDQHRRFRHAVCPREGLVIVNA